MMLGFVAFNVLFLEGYTPRVICANAVDKGDRRRFGVKAVDKGVTRKLKSESRNSRGGDGGRLKGESVPIQKGKELRGGVGAGRAARCDFTVHDRVG
jgi:hypothetical protein